MWGFFHCSGNGMGDVDTHNKGVSDEMIKERIGKWEYLCIEVRGKGRPHVLTTDAGALHFRLVLHVLE